LRGDALSGGNAPAMARLAASGVQFKRAIAPGNMTSPSTNSMLSCRKATTLGPVAFAYSVKPEERANFYARKEPSFPARFKAAAYDTAMIGNVSVISEVFGVGVDHGFAQQVAIETEAYDTAQVTREATAWLQAHANRPFFLYLHYNGPHAPYRAPLRDLISVFPGLVAFRSYPDVLRWLYQGEVRYTDRYLDRLLDALGRLGLDKTTTVILAADHGDHHTTRAFKDNEVGPDFTGAYFDHGATLLNDEITVPLLIHRPKGPTGVEVYDFVSTLDIGPTLLDLAGIDGGAACEGQSLRPFFDFTKGQPPERGERAIGSEGFRGRALIFDGRFKYIRNYAPTEKRFYAPGAWVGRKTTIYNSEELYDLLEDPSEAYNLARKNPVLLARARAQYRDFYAVVGGYELVIEGPSGSAFTVRLPPGTGLLAGERDPDIEGVHKTASGTTVAGTLRHQVIIKIDNLSDPAPVVELGGARLDLRATTLRLPYKKGEELPLEAGGAATLLPPGPKPTAYLRRVEDANYQERAIVTGDPRFEKILREWGYLHEE
jgi:arylsulfatase A-like enzyme